MHSFVTTKNVNGVGGVV